MEKENQDKLEDQMRFEFFSKIREQEDSYLRKHPITSVFGQGSTIQTTEYLAEGCSPTANLPAQTVIRPDYFRKIFFIVWSGIVLVAIKSYLFSHPISFITILILLAVVVFLLLNLLPFSATSYITLNRKTISIDGQQYKWSEILEIYLVKRPERLNSVALVLGFSNGEMSRFPLERFVSFSSGKINQIVRAIEYYKRESENQEI